MVRRAAFTMLVTSRVLQVKAPRQAPTRHLRCAESAPWRTDGSYTSVVCLAARNSLDMQVICWVLRKYETVSGACAASVMDQICAGEDGKKDNAEI